MNDQYTSKLVVVDEKPDSAEIIARVLRDSGYLLPVNWVNSALRLQKTLEADSNAIVVANAQLAWLPLDQICQSCRSQNVVTIALGDVSDLSLMLRVMRQGAFSLATPDHPGLLEQSIKQALEHTRVQQELLDLTSHVNDLDKRCDVLLDTASEPVAYTSEGVITRANPTFAELIGAADGTQLIGRLISDFIGPESLYLFSRNLRQLMRSDSSHAYMEGTAINTLAGTTLPANIIMHNLLVDGEHSTQILLRDVKSQTPAQRVPGKPDPSQMLNLMDVPLGQQLKDNITQKTAPPALSLVHDQGAYDADSQFELKPALENASLHSMMARLNAWENKPSETDDGIPASANDSLTLKPLAELVAAGQASLCTQPLLGMHGDDTLLLTRVRVGDSLMPVAQMLEDSSDLTTINWLLEELNALSQKSHLVLGPISKEAITANSIEVLQTLKSSNQLILGISEQTLTSDYHGSSQFLLQLQKLDMQAALWMTSTPSVLGGVLNDLANSVRNGLHSVVLKPEQAPLGDDNSVSDDWATLAGLCEKFDIQTVAPCPNTPEQLQTWWQLGAGWCLASDSAASMSLQSTGTSQN